MDIATNDVGQLRKSFKVVVTAKEIQEKYIEKTEYVQKNIVFKGFRVGHVPVSVIERKYGDAINHEIRSELLRDVLASIEDKNKLKVLGEPQFKEEQGFKRDADWNFEFVVDLQPQFELPQYKGLEAKKPVVTISDEELQARLDELLKSKGSLIVIDNEASKENDHLIADITITVGETKLWEKQNYNLTILDTSIFGLAVPKTHFLNRKSNDVVEFTITVPAEYDIAEHRGKEAKFTCKIAEVKRLKPAELTDEFVKEFNSDNVENFRKYLKDTMLMEKQYHIEMQVEDELLDKVLASVQFDLPEAFIADRIAKAKEDFERHQKNDLKKDDKQIAEEWQKEEEKALKDWRERMKEYFLLGRIADQENIEVTEEDMNNHFMGMSMRYGQPARMVRKQYEQLGMIDEIRYDIRKRKVLMFLREQAKITETTEAPKATCDCGHDHSGECDHK